VAVRGLLLAVLAGLAVAVAPRAARLAVLGQAAKAPQVAADLRFLKRVAEEAAVKVVLVELAAGLATAVVAVPAGRTLTTAGRPTSTQVVAAEADQSVLAARRPVMAAATAVPQAGRPQRPILVAVAAVPVTALMAAPLAGRASSSSSSQTQPRRL
jgi:hypothetical protein